MLRVAWPLGRLALASLLTVALSGCMGMGGLDDAKPETEAAATEEIDPRRYLGPDYCPELRIREGLELARTYQAGQAEDPANVVWQASLGETARECLYDLQGNLTLRIGISGRVVTGPKGGPGAVAVPLRIAVVKYQEAVLHNQLYPVSVTIAGGSSAVFGRFYEWSVPSPGQDRVYLIYVGYDEKGKPHPRAKKSRSRRGEETRPPAQGAGQAAHPAAPQTTEQQATAAAAQQVRPIVLPVPVSSWAGDRRVCGLTRQPPPAKLPARTPCRDPHRIRRAGESAVRKEAV
jgi:hypothetical protein